MANDEIHLCDNNITIQNSEAYNQVSSLDGFDGGGIDIDQSCTNCIVQRNYIHDNAGSGFSLFQGSGSAWSGNTFRYNITQNNGNGTSNVKCEITIGAGLGAELNCLIYNNTFYASRTGNPIALLTDVNATGHFANNIFYSSGASTLATVTGNPTGMLFTGNDYYAASTFLLRLLVQSERMEERIAFGRRLPRLPLLRAETEIEK